MIKSASRKILSLITAGCIVLLLTGIALYLLAQSLLAQIVTTQLHQAGFSNAKIDDVRLYADGIVIKSIQLNDQTHLTGIFTPQSAPDIAKHGLKNIIIKLWDQTLLSLDDLPTHWPFAQLETLTIETMKLNIALPVQNVVLTGTVKSLRPAPANIVLVMPFDTQDDAYNLQGKLELVLDHGQLMSLDVNLDEGGFASSDLSLKRMTGWLNTQFSATAGPAMQAQFMAGAVNYNGESFADGMVQYSRDNTDAALWTVNLNRAAENYFNTWSIKPTRDNRFAVQVAAQRGAQSKSAVLISAAPLRLEPLLPAVH